MKFLKKIRPRHFFKAVRLPLLTVIVLALAADIWCETAGVPDVFAKAILRSLEQRGLSCSVDDLKAGIFRGVRAGGVTIWDGDSEGGRMFAADRMKITFRKSSLLFGRLTAKYLRISGGNLYFPVPDGTVGEKHLPFLLEKIRARIGIEEDRISVLTLYGELNGLQVQLSGEMEGLSGMKQAPDASRRGTGDPSPLLGWQQIQQGIPDPTVGFLQELRVFLEQQLFVSDNAFIKGGFQIDLQDFSACSGEVLFQFFGASINNVPVASLKGKVTLENKIVLIPHAAVRLGEESFASGEGAYNLETKVVSGTLDGSMTPRVVYQFLDRPMPVYLAAIQFAIPPKLNLRMDPSPLLDTRRWQLEGTVNAGNVSWQGTRMGHLTCEFEHRDGQLGIRDFTLKADRQDREWVSFSCKVDDQTLSLKGEGSVQLTPARIVSFLPDSMNRLKNTLLTIGINDEVPRLDVDLEHASLYPLDLRGKATFYCRDLSWREVTLKEVTLPLHFDGPLIEISPEGMSLTLDDQQQVKARGTWNARRNTLTLSGQGDIFPVRLLRRMKLGKSYLLDALKLEKTPLKATFDLPEMSLGGRDWKLSGTLKAEDFDFGAASVKKVTGQFEVFPDHLRLTSLAGQGDRIDGLTIPELMVKWPRTEVTFVNGSGTLDPRLLSGFLPPTSHDSFLKAWEPFEWQEKLPLLEVASFAYRTQGGRHWQLTLDGVLKDENTRYYNVPFETFSGHVRLDLPRKIDVTDIEVQDSHYDARGQLEIVLGSEPVLSFEGRGRMDPVKIVAMALPQLSPKLKGVSVSDDTRMVMEGQMYLKGQLRPLISCQMDGSRLLVRGLPLEDYALNWTLNKQDLRWAIERASVGGGTLAAEGYTNGFTGAGKLETAFKSLSLQKLVAGYAGLESDVDLGRISGQIMLNSSKPPGAEHPNLVGDGKIKIRDGEFNKTFLVQKLVTLLGLGRVGLITACDAELEFEGDKVRVTRLATDGTFLALKGSGTYAWTKAENGLNFTIRGEVLKATSLIPLITRPLSWFFEAELTGSLAEPQWRMRSPLRALIPGKGKKPIEDDPMEFDLLPEK